MSTRDFLHFLFETSQVDASTEALLRESEATERMTAKKTPLLKALKNLGIPVENVTIDDEGARLTVPDAALWHEIVRKLGSVEAVNDLADEGWVPEFAGDVADTTELPEYVLNFLPLHDVEPSEQAKATPVDALNKEVQGGSDTVIPDEQKKRDGERRHGVKVGESDLSVPERHQKKIALDTLKMSDSGAEIMGGMSKEEAKNFLRKIGYSDARIAKLSEGEAVSEVDKLLEAPELPDPASRSIGGRGARVMPSRAVEPNGSLKITVNDSEDLAELKEKVAAGDTSDSLFIDAIDHALGNGLNLVRPELIGALTSSLILSDVPINDEADAKDSEGAKFWWYPDYQVRSPVEDLAEKGYVIFQPADPAEREKAVAPVVSESETAGCVCEWCGHPTSERKEFECTACNRIARPVKEKAPGWMNKSKKASAKKDESLDALLPEPGNEEHDHELDDYDLPTDDQGQPIVVEYAAGADKGQMGWSEFIEVNGDGMDFADFSRIRDTILRGETYRGGGGAAGEYTVKRVPHEPLDAEADDAARRKLDPTPRDPDRETFNTP